MLPEAAVVFVDVPVVVVHILDERRDCQVAVGGHTTHIAGWVAHGFVRPPLRLAAKMASAPPWQASLSTPAAGVGFPVCCLGGLTPSPWEEGGGRRGQEEGGGQRRGRK